MQNDIFKSLVLPDQQPKDIAFAVVFNEEQHPEFETPEPENVFCFGFCLNENIFFI